MADPERCGCEASDAGPVRHFAGAPFPAKRPEKADSVIFGKIRRTSAQASSAKRDRRKRKNAWRFCRTIRRTVCRTLCRTPFRTNRAPETSVSRKRTGCGVLYVCGACRVASSFLVGPPLAASEFCGRNQGIFGLLHAARRIIFGPGKARIPRTPAEPRKKPFAIP